MILVSISIMQLIEKNVCDICCRPEAITVISEANAGTGCGYTEDIWLACEHRVM